MNLKGTGMPAYIDGKKNNVRSIPAGNAETVDKDMTWEWTRKSDWKVETEALIFAAQERH